MLAPSEPCAESLTYSPSRRPWPPVMGERGQGLSVVPEGCAPEANVALDKAVSRHRQSRIKECYSFLPGRPVLFDEVHLTKNMTCVRTAFGSPVVGAR